MDRETLLTTPELAFPQALETFECTADGRRLVLDPGSLAFLEVNDVAGALLEQCTSLASDALYDHLAARFGAERTGQVLDEFLALKKKGFFLEPASRPPVPPSTNRAIHCASLSLTFGCNLRCKYCYADGGSYGAAAEAMSPAVCERAIDMIFRQAGEAPVCSISFFGGEPLLNFDLLQHAVRYARERADAVGKDVRFSITTNMTLMTEEKMDFLDAHGVGILVSIDGPPEVQDAVRPTAGGEGSYALMRPGIELLVRRRGRASCRATLHGHNYRIREIVRHLRSLGFTSIALTPVTAPEGSFLAFQPETLGLLEAEYEAFAQEYVQSILAGDYYGFVPFQCGIQDTHRFRRRGWACGAGTFYVAVSPQGDVYPCHRFQGVPEWKLGTVTTALDEGARDRFFELLVDRREECASCWARFFCGGGCAYEAWVFHGDLRKPYQVHCFFRKLTMRLSMQIYSRLHERDRKILDTYYDPSVDPYREAP